MSTREGAKESARELRVAVENAGEVSALLLRPAGAETLLVLAHGAGAGMRHPFLEALARDLAAVRVATLRYQFPYVEHRRKIPDVPSVLTATVRAAVHTATDQAPDLPLLAGGKSMGGRMTSQAAAQQPLAKVRGLVFVGFPLHPPARPGIERAEHLARVNVPMLFLQGTARSIRSSRFAASCVRQTRCARYAQHIRRRGSFLSHAEKLRND